MNLKKQIIVFISVLTVLLIGLLGVRFWYDSKCVKFQDKNMEIQTLYLLDTGRGRVLKKELDRIEHFYVTNKDGRFTTLEDLKQFPNLKSVSLDYGVRSMTDEEKEEFQKQRKTIQPMLAETLPDLKDLRELDLTGFDHFENLDFLSECTQIEELTIWDSQVEDIRGIQNMENLRILDLNLNPFTDISPLQNLKHLEAVNLCWVPVENLEILTMIPSLKLVMYEPASQEEERILQKLERQGVTVYREASDDWWLWKRQREKDEKALH